jgi:hypothetical protein
MRRAEARAGRLIRRGRQPGREQARSPLVNSGVRAVAAALRAYRADGTITSHHELAWLARALDDQEVRDEAWLRMDPTHREAHQRLWADLTRAAPPQYQAAPASLLALAAWQDGNGPLAHVALDRALAARPGYPMARLLRMAIDHGAPPFMADPGLCPAARQGSHDTPCPARQPRLTRQCSPDAKREEPRGPRRTDWLRQGQPGAAQARRRRHPQRSRRHT